MVQLKNFFKKTIDKYRRLCYNITKIKERGYQNDDSNRQRNLNIKNEILQ